MPEFDLNVLLAAVFGLFVVYLLGKTLLTPAKALLRLMGMGALGALVLFIFNLVAGLFQVTIGINAVTALVVGYMGLPGLVMLVLLQRMLG